MKSNFGDHFDFVIIMAELNDFILASCFSSDRKVNLRKIIDGYETAVMPCGCIFSPPKIFFTQISSFIQTICIRISYGAK